jgi:hypothetical protein
VTSGVDHSTIAIVIIGWILSLVVIDGGLAGCNLKEKYARNNFGADQWLQANRGSATVSVQEPGRRGNPAGESPNSQLSTPH